MDQLVRLALGWVPMLQANLSENFKTIMLWADEFRKLKVRTNAETVKDCQTARDFKRRRHWLCRTEHMFFSEDRMDHVHKMILASNKSERNQALEKLLPIQQKILKRFLK